MALTSILSLGVTFFPTIDGSSKALCKVGMKGSAVES